MVRDERSGVPHGAEVLRRVEAERRREPACPGAKPIPGGARRLAGVLDEREAERPEPPHVSELPVEMDREDESRAVRDRCSRGIGVEVEVCLLDVSDDRSAAGLRDRFERRDEGHRRDDYFLPALEARRDQRDTQRVQAAGHPHAACNAGLGGESFLEARDRGSAHERARLHQLRKVLEDLGRQRCMCPGEVHEGDSHHTSVIGRPLRTRRLRRPRRQREL